MTAVLDQTVNMTEFEFTIPCEWEDGPCDKPATVMCKGCADTDARAICNEHLEALRQWFYGHAGARCLVCERPFMHFSTHYDIMEM